MARYKDIPEPEYLDDWKKITRIYAKAWRDIETEIYKINKLKKKDRLKREDYLKQQQSIMRQLTVIFERLREDVGQELEPVLERSFVNGQASMLVSISEYSTLKEAMEGVSNSMLAKERMKKLITDTQSDLLKATDNTEEGVKRMVRESVSKVMSENAVQASGTRTISKQIEEQLTKKALKQKLDKSGIAIKDAGGKRWHISTYTRMVSRTKLMTSFMDGVDVEMQERGIDLARISSHGAKDECRHFEGLVISMRGETDGYKTYREIRSTNKCFHPNCKHSVTPVRKMENLPSNLREKHKEKERESDEAMTG